MLRNLRIREEYFTGQANLVDSFYKPCLAASIRYDRSVGFFRSSVFLLIGPDVIEFAKRGGKIRLISSPDLTEEDIAAMKEGYDSKQSRASRALLRDIELLFSNKEIAKNTEALATLITLGALDVKLTFSPEAIGEYHAKLGVFCDDTGDSIVFKGSINETWRGWHERGNHETLDAFRGWHEGSEKQRVIRNRTYFEKLWNNQIENLEVLPFPDTVLEKLKTVAKDSIEDIDSGEIIDFFRLGHTKATTRNIDKRIPQSGRSPLRHQIQAIEEWKKQGRQGILEHATGSGKTFTAITALKEHLEPEGLAIVLVPDKLLHKQWEDELNNEIEGIRLLKAGAGHNKWKKDGKLRAFTSPLGGLGKRVVLVTMQTARTGTFLKGINQNQNTFVIADEVHEIGSQENSKVLIGIKSEPRLGLSATPKRYGDPEGTKKILNYFGPIVQPPYTLSDAISDKRLVPYEYFPKAVHLSANESKYWAEETEKISREYARSRRDKDDNVIVSSYLKYLLIQRSRISKRAEAKVPLAVSITKEHYQTDESWLIYCEDQSQLREVMEALKQEGFNPLEYHTNMEGNPEATLEYFQNFGGVLCSIKCLDQGVDIPKISHAIILASSQNPRQFIQRRGRVLRVCSGKHKSVIFDAVVIPVSLELEPEQLSLLKSEFQRSLQFAEMSLNKSAANELINLAIELGIDPQEIGLTESDGIEED